MEHPAQQALYVFNPRDEVRPFIPSDVRSVLDVGCGAGGFGATLRETLGPEARLVGIDVMPEQALRARQGGGFDEVHLGYFPKVLENCDETFDLIVFNDVLEHMLDPWQVLEDALGFLAQGGRVLATIPSIQFAPVLWRVARGRWDYADEGTLDRTHVRFFTKATMIEMFERCGYEVDSCHGVNSVARLWETDPNPVRRWFKARLAKRLGDAQYVQFVIVATSRRGHLRRHG